MHHRSIVRALLVPVVAFALQQPAQAGTLQDLYQQALANDLNLQAARHQRDAALEARPQAAGALRPQVTAQAGARQNRFEVLSVNNPANTNYRSNDEVFLSTNYSLQLSQPLFDWAAFKRLAAADESTAQAQAAFAASEQNLYVRFVSAYFAVLAAEDTLRADLDAQAAFKQQAEQQGEKYRSGLASVTDAKNAQASYDSISASVIADRLAVNTAKRALSLIVGTPVQAVAPLRDEFPLSPPTPNVVDAWVDAALADNPALLSARRAADAARQQRAAATGARLPTVTAIGGVMRDTSDSTFGYNSQTAYVGANLTWFLYRGGQVSSAIRAADASAQQAESLYQLQRRSIEQDVRNHFDGITSGIAAVRAAANAVQSQQASVVATEVGFKVGTRTIVDVLYARQSLVSAQKSLAQVRYDYLVNLLSLKADVGQASATDLDDLDRLTVANAQAAHVEP